MLLDDLQSVLDLVVASIEEEDAGCPEAALSGLQAAFTQLTYAHACSSSELDAAANSLVDEICTGLLSTFASKSKVSLFHNVWFMHAAFFSGNIPAWNIQALQSMLDAAPTNQSSDLVATPTDSGCVTDGHGHGAMELMEPEHAHKSSKLSQMSDDSNFEPPSATKDRLVHLMKQQQDQPPLQQQAEPLPRVQSFQNMRGQEVLMMGSEEPDGLDAAGSSAAAADSLEVLQQCQRHVTGSLDDVSGLE